MPTWSNVCLWDLIMVTEYVGIALRPPPPFRRALMIEKNAHYLRHVRSGWFLWILIPWLTKNLSRIPNMVKIGQKYFYCCQWRIIIMFSIWMKWCHAARPSVRPHVSARLPHGRFQWNLRNYMKICREMPNCVKIGRGRGESGNLHEHLSTF